ncbi:MAG: S-methyl-5-thioribose kinase [Fastidiosipila sp.]|nr:S-methyl-5-thioribose kinase [Fastidiosipila sp.]
MSKYDTYFQMAVGDVVDFTLKKTKDYIDWDIETMEAIVPPEHGNLNHVYRVLDGKGNSIFIKQASRTLRISEDMTATLDRNRLESELLIIQDKYVPGMVPKIYFYDTVMSASGMEDCTDYTVMRNAMLAHEIFPHFADDISTFMVNTLLMTSDVVMNHVEKKKRIKEFINPDLCDITEKLVLMEPYMDLYDRNNVYPPNADFVQKELYNDEALHLEVAKLKFNFMTNAQALIHGDLHTGSIFISQNNTKVFDPEFGTFAPMGYDTGNVIANLVFAYGNGLVYDKKDFCQWVLDTIRDTLDLFIEKFTLLYEQEATEPMAKIDGFKEWYLNSILDDTAGYAGTELHRRTVGMANVTDLTTIEDEEKRSLAERICIYLGKELILNQANYRTGDDYVRAVYESEKKAKASL